jgi:DNA-binding LacI/PurR family transcriptional regulator
MGLDEQKRQYREDTDQKHVMGIILTGESPRQDRGYENDRPVGRLV